MKSRARNARRVTGEGRVVEQLRARIVELEREAKQAHRSADDAIAANQRTLDTIAELVRPGRVLNDGELIDEVRGLVEMRARVVGQLGGSVALVMPEPRGGFHRSPDGGRR